MIVTQQLQELIARTIREAGLQHNEIVRIAGAGEMYVSRTKEHSASYAELAAVKVDGEQYFLFRRISL